MFRKVILILSFIICLSIPILLSGQKDNYFRHTFTIKDGLPNNDVRWITQDHSGFLWIATWDGLVRYDGTEFKVYRHDPNDTNSLGYFEINRICVDSNNQIWTFSANKLCRYNRAHDHFISYDKYDFQDSTPLDSPPVFRLVFLDPFGQLYVSFGKGLYKYHHIEDKFLEIYRDSSVIASDSIDYITFDNLGSLWMFQIYNKKRKLAYQCEISENDTLSLLKEYPADEELMQHLSPNATLHLEVFRNSTGNTWITSNGGLFKLIEDTIRPFEGQIPPEEFSGQNIILWAQPKKGLMAYYPAAGKQQLISDTNEVQVLAYFTDKQKNIWYTDYNSISRKSGLKLAYPMGNYFKHPLSKENNAIQYNIYGLMKDKSGNIWAGGRPNDHIVKITSKMEVSKIRIPIDSKGHYNLPRDMVLDSGGDIWIAFFHDYLYKFNPETLEFTDFSDEGILGLYPNHNARFRLVKSLRDGRLITGGKERIYILDKLNFNGKFIDIPPFSDSYSVYEDAYGYLWIGLNGQMIKSDLNLTNQEIIVISDNSYNIEDICPGDSTDLWLALLGGGIGHFSPEKGTTTFFTTTNGLAHNTVYSIKKDRSGNLWASHDLGISMLNPQTNIIVNFNEKDGLHIREFDSEAAFQTEDGEILFGGVGGIVTFYPDSVKRNRLETLTPLLISEFRISNKILDFDLPISELKSVKLPKGTDNFQLVLIKPDLRYGDEISYRYRLEGSNKEWIITDSRHRRINYTSLKPGTHNFQAEATDLNGKWNYRTHLIVYIPPYFYQTMIFKILMMMIFIGIVFLIFIMKLKQSRLKELRKYEQLRLETLHSQMNPHFISNSLNAVNYFITLNDTGKANQYLTDLSRLMRSILNHSSQEFIPISSEISAIQNYLNLEHNQFSDKFDYLLEIEQTIDQETTEIIPLLVQPFIENSIRHGLKHLKGRKGLLVVRFTRGDDSFIVCEVEDDGIGRKLSQQQKTWVQNQHKSRGLAIMTERLAILNSIYKTNYTIYLADLYCDKEETGTRARIEIPVKIKGRKSKFDER